MKQDSKIIIILVIVLACGAVTVFANKNAEEATKKLEAERYERMNLEQTLQKAQKKITGLEKELSESNSKMSSIERILNDGKVANKEMMNELEALRKAKTDAEAALMEAQKKAAAQAEQAARQAVSD